MFIGTKKKRELDENERKSGKYTQSWGFGQHTSFDTSHAQTAFVHFHEILIYL